MTLTVKIVGKEEAIVRLKAMGPAIQDRVDKALLALGYDLREHIVKDKLSGQVLKRRSGRLSGNIDVSPITVQGTKHTVKVGTNVEYAAIHEYGGTIHHPGGTPYFIIRSTGLARFVRKDNPYAWRLAATRAHLITMPERSFLRSALADMTPEIRERIALAVAEAVKA